MGLGNGGKMIFLSIREGKVVHRVSETEIQSYDHVSGFLKGIVVKMDGKFGPELHIHLADQDYYTLQMFLHSGYASAFLKAIRNVKTSERFSIVPTFREKEGKKNYGMILSQGGVPVKWYYTKDTPNGMPEMQHGIWENDKGEVYEGWNSDLQIQFLIEEIQKHVMPNLAPVPVDQAPPQATAYQPSQVNNFQQPAFDNTQHMPDDLPF